MFVIKGGISTKEGIIDIGHSIPRIQTMKDLCDCLLRHESEITSFQVFGSRRCELCDQMFDAERLEELV